MAEQNHQYIIRVKAENIKRVKVVDFKPNRYVTKVSGANGAGKTSALDAILYALADRKTLPPSILTKGKKKGEISLETNTHLIERKVDANGGGLLILDKATNQLIKDPVDWLEKLAGELGFDPLKFMRMKPDDQFSILKTLVPMDEDLDTLELQNEQDEARKTRRKAEIRSLESARDQISVDKDLATDPIDTDTLWAESRLMSEFNRQIEQEQRRRATIEAEHHQRMEYIAAKKKQLANLESEIAAAESSVKETAKTIGEWKELAEPKDVREIERQIREASELNSRIIGNNKDREQRANLEQSIDAIQMELTELSDSIRDRKVRIGSALQKARFPIPGLSFETLEEGSGGRERKNPKKVVTYRGLPLSEASSGEQIRVSTAIGMAGKPELRFLLIREGSLLDNEGMAILEEMAHENDWQILMEVVDQSGKVGIYLEDGEVKAVNQEPEPATPAKKTSKKRIAAKD